MKLTIPAPSLVVLMGPSGCGKSTFARRNFLPTESVSSDYCRGLVGDDENDQSVTAHAFEMLHTIVAKRLELGRLTVVDATNVLPDSRRSLLALARRYHVLPVAVVFDVPEDLCHARNALRPDRQFGMHVVRNQMRSLHHSIRKLKDEGFRYVLRLRSAEEVDTVEIERTKVFNDKRELTGPFDIIGDIHGCVAELDALLARLDGERQVIFLGDLVDRGPDSPAVLRRVMEMVANGRALCVPGNHDFKLLRHLQGKKVQPTHGLAETLEQLKGQPAEWIEELKVFLESLVSHYVLDDGKLVVAHAGLKAEFQGRASGTVRAFCLYGETTGETDEFGLPVRYNWAAEYRGRAVVVYGHTPVVEPEWLNKTINIDTGCVFGGHLTALRYPEMELVSVPAERQYAVPAKPLQASSAVESDALDLADFLGRQTLHTRYMRRLTVREDFSIAALEALSRFAVDPRWLIYLPPTMSPAETSLQDGYLEHAAEALAGYANLGVDRVICQEKHMGSRAVVVVCRDVASAAKHFWGVEGGGVIYTRTGRPFFDDLEYQNALLERLRRAIEAAGLWDELKTSWLCLDCELMPWSLKAESLLRDQYAAVGSAAVAHLEAAVALLGPAPARPSVLGVGAAFAGVHEELAERYGEKLAAAHLFRQAYRRYCWEVPVLDDLRLAPFHIMASAGRTYFDQEHRWHMETLARLGEHDAIFRTTRWKEHDLSQDPQPIIDWWLAMTAAGGEGMVMKPRQFLTIRERGVLQPAIKCRGKEYLRIIYGPDYDRPENLSRLRHRGLNTKRSLALREFCLGLEGLERFTAHEPLSRVHECAFGVLAMESQPVDPRL